MKSFINIIKKYAVVLAGLAAVIVMALSAWVWVQARSNEPVAAPEGAAILAAQATLPFQILIPAYLPEGFEREQVKIESGLRGPEGQPLVRLTYTHPLSVSLTLDQWMPPAPITSTVPMGSMGSMTGMSCPCMAMRSGMSMPGMSMPGMSQSYNPNLRMIDSGPLRITGQTSDAIKLSPSHVQVILNSLAPASGLLTYTIIENVPLLPNLPEAEEVPVNAAGVQEVMLVVVPEGYTPQHFSVKKGVPVRVVFRQLGEFYGAINELYIPWGGQPDQQGHLTLAGPDDTQVVEFTPQQTGDFLFHCAHYVDLGVMTVTD